MSKAKRWFVIINPTSGNGSSKKKWPRIKSLLEDYNFEFDFCFTEFPKHSIKLIHNAVNQGFKDVIVIGGDGTLHNVVNAIQTQKYSDPSLIKIGIIPVGTGNDWIKTYGISKNPRMAMQVIAKGNYKHQDIGKIEFLNSNQEPVFFNNLAGIGFDGFVVSKVAKYKNLGAIAYLIAALIGLFSYKNFKAEISVNSNLIKTKALMVVIGLCKYSGGGMQLTKNPNPSDGYFDISIAKDFSKFDIIKNLLNLFNGKITKYKKIETIKSDSIIIKTEDKHSSLIEADGELIGEGNFKVTLLKDAFVFYA